MPDDGIDETNISIGVNHVRRGLAQCDGGRIGPPAGQLDTQRGILDTGFHIRVVVHFDHHDAIADLLQVDTVKSIADHDWAGAACGLNHLRWGEFYVERFMLAGAMLLLFRFPVINLPMSSGHVGLTGEQWLVIENTDAPIIFARSGTP